tara:strand:- start:171 stop:317 length:147 start_codon:yes stop_codon:yes gene_type:complete
MARYVEAFEERGYDDLDSVKSLNEEMLDELGVRVPRHRAVILASAKEL